MVLQEVGGPRHPSGNGLVPSNPKIKFEFAKRMYVSTVLERTTILFKATSARVQSAQSCKMHLV